LRNGQFTIFIILLLYTMKHTLSFKSLAVTAFLLLVVHFTASAQFQMQTSAFKKGGSLGMEQVFSGFGCTGKNISPALNWKNAPKNTKSFALTVYDPDAPTGSGWWHWVMYNIPANTDSLAANAGNPDLQLAPTGSIQGATDFGAKGYGGPCPPMGDKPHRYIFTLHALKTDKLDIPAGATAALVGFYVYQNTIAKTTLTGLYSRK
jgi:Raf kinase inhibitor-like YbhB/YbcL family protein